MPGRADDSQSDTQQAAATYRCVCGEVLPLHEADGRCPGCGRQYDSSVLRDADAETVELFVRLNQQAAVPEESEHEAAADPLLGKKLGHFQILERLGGGGMGAVYRALDESLQRYVALKVLRPATGSRQEGSSGAKESTAQKIQLLFQEARAQARVNHPHVAHIYYVGVEDETPFLAMELVGKHTLAQRLKYGPLSFPETARFALQLAEALAHAARFDIVHGDVKPSNILLVDHRTVKLSDFGLARKMTTFSGPAGSTAGTPKYMAPEATLGQATDHRSDMYSLGVTLFEMTFGRLPYQNSNSRNLVELLRQHREAPVDFPDPWPAHIPAAWRDVLSRLLAKNPADRYPDFQSLIADLKKLQPVALPAARPLLRLLAWMFDTFLLAAPVALLAFLLISWNRPVLQLAGVLSLALIPLGASYLQAWWGTTPGKKLFQIRIVDQHGLRPASSVLALRAVFQFLVVWDLVAGLLFNLLGLADIAATVSLLVLAFLVVEGVCTVLTRRYALHDLFFGTRVVLDAARSGEAM